MTARRQWYPYNKYTHTSIIHYMAFGHSTRCVLFFDSQAIHNAHTKMDTSIASSTFCSVFQLRIFFLLLPSFCFFFFFPLCSFTAAISFIFICFPYTLFCETVCFLSHPDVCSLYTSRARIHWNLCVYLYRFHREEWGERERAKDCDWRPIKIGKLLGQNAFKQKQ